MFSNSLKRLPLKRCLHTQIPRTSAQSRAFSGRIGLTVGASLAVGSYLAWRLTHDQRIALDSATKLEVPSTTAVIDGPSSATSRPTPVKKQKIQKEEAAPASSTSEFVEEESQKTETEGETEEQASSEGGGGGGAYNPVTGEINWDCPCLGGMAYGPCGPEFREAFSCFIHSEEEPKGIDCVEKFKGMQSCFKAHPEHYADEIMDDDEDEAPQTQPSTDSPDSQPSSDASPTPETTPSPVSDASASQSS